MDRDVSQPVAKMRVLVATRDPAVARRLLELLRATGMEVRWGEPDRIEGNDPELSVADILVIEAPSFGDAEQALVERVRERSPMAEIVFLSAEPAIEGAVEAYKTGVYAVLPSPVSRKQLVEALQGASGRKRRGEQRIRAMGQKEEKR